MERAEKAIHQAKGGCDAKTKIDMTMSAKFCVHLIYTTRCTGPCSTVHCSKSSDLSPVCSTNDAYVQLFVATVHLQSCSHVL